MRARNRALLVVCLACVAAAGVALTIAIKASEAFAWRFRVVQAKLTGELPELPLLDLGRWLAPNSPVYLEPLAEIANVHSGIRNPLSDTASVERGSQVYGRVCARCHGDNARGGAGPGLISLISATTDWAFFSAVKWGRRGTAMAAQPLSDVEIWQTHAYLRQFALASSGGDAPATSSGRRRIDVPAESILAPSDRAHEWLTYAGNYAGHRHSSLSQISRRNVRDLRVAWVAQLRSADLSLEASPIVAGGLIFVTESPEGVVALDARNGDRVWQYRRPVRSGVPLCCGSPNRGVAILGDSVFVATLDAYLVALDTSTGRKKWETKVADFRDGYSMTGAPLAISDRVIVGVAGGEFGIRGFLAAFSATDGRLLWKFYTVPGPGEPGHESWAGESWKAGGAPTWTIGAYDPKLDLIYWGVGNPAPVYQGDARTGDNLFSNSVLALEAGSGKLRWHFQFTPGDEHDWDAVQQPVLTDLLWEGQRRAVLLFANRSGFFYVIDRQTGQFLLARPFVKQTWAAGFKPNGRPILRLEARPSRTGTLVWPNVGGGTNWWPPSYDESRRLLYVPTVDAASIFFRSEARFDKGKEFLASASQLAANYPASTAIKAIQAETGDIRWEAQLEGGGPEVLRSVGGVLSTAGGLVFVGYRDKFIAFDADTGGELWQFRVGGPISAPPVAYASDQTQFVAVMGGHSLFVFALPPSAQAYASRER